MDVSRGPTDNLYKFIALSGIAMCCLGIVLANNLISSWTTADIEASTSFQMLQGHFHVSEGLRKARKTIIEAEINSEGDENYIEAIKQRLKTLENHVTDFDSHLPTMLDARVKTETVLALERSFRTRMWIYCFLILTGIAMAGFGFYFWYVRLQVFLDKKVELDALQ